MRRIVAAVGPMKGDEIIEIGPGRGALTQLLLNSDATLTAIELDRELVPVLLDQFGSRPNFRLIEGDALEIDLRSIVGGQKAKLAANLPYYISTAILQKLIANRELFSLMVLMFQREVVERICAAPGESERGYLSVLVQEYLTVKRLFDVPPEAFRPRPKIWSSVVLAIPRNSALGDSRHFERLISLGFAHKRKTILNNLRAAYPDAVVALQAAGIDSHRRAETLSNDEWLRLHEAISPE